MKFKEYSHRYGLEIVKDMPVAHHKYIELCNVLESINDYDLINEFQKRKIAQKKGKSLARIINTLIKEKLTDLGWENESYIFKNSEINKSTRDWRLDFVSPEIFSVEVAFNHSSAATANLMKPVLASELNHVEKQFQTKFGIVIAVTKDFKKRGGFDNAIGTFEGYRLQCKPLMNQLTVPMIIIGLESPKSFEIIHSKVSGGTTGSVYLKGIDRELKNELISEDGELREEKIREY